MFYEVFVISLINFFFTTFNQFIQEQYYELSKVFRLIINID